MFFFVFASQVLVSINTYKAQKLKQKQKIPHMYYYDMYVRLLRVSLDLVFPPSAEPSNKRRGVVSQMIRRVRRERFNLLHYLHTVAEPNYTTQCYGV